ncbi:MAG: D-alanyl-D-alanine carboxypeptidase/D-alanyl-D-alanine-endopeptidase [Gemmatimonadales bacterium]|nr:D-alanyl-D-alanine carboxypeptidase/D-alanyl-D-alanine-endopeptidase [Gemmatimonadales bacterium]
MPRPTPGRTTVPGAARRRHSVRSVAAALLLVGAAAARPPAVAAQQRALEARLDAAPWDRTLWGVALLDDRGRVLFGRNERRLFVPASNTKLVVAAAAAVLLDPAQRQATSLYAGGPVADGVLRGPLVLYGRGDPTFARRCYAVDTTAADACDADPLARLRELARTLRERGIRRVEGDLVGDGSFFGGPLVHPQWETYDLGWWYAAPVSGLGFNDNSIDLAWKPGPAGAPPVLALAPALGTVTLDNRAVTDSAGAPETIDFFRDAGATAPLVIRAEGRAPADASGGTEYVAHPDPDRWTAEALRVALLEAGIVVTGRTWSTRDSTLFAAARATPPLAEVRGRPVRDWIFPILNTSQNWYAEQLLKLLGRTHGRAGDWREGVAVERRFLIDSVGVDSLEVAVQDGSGLSASNLVSPRAFAQLLRYMRRHPRWDVFSAGLPRSGQRGSLLKRFTGSPLEGRVLAKTGSIGGVNTLSGYLERPDGRVWTFSVLANHHAQPYRAALAQLDSVVVEMGRLPAR